MGAQHCSVKNGKKGKGKSHAHYVVGKGKYSEREDVLSILTGNMPDWAPDGVTFFVAADKHERLNGRSYKEVEFAIPREVEDPVAYAAAFAEKLLGKNHPYLAGVHTKLAADGLPNTHCHLMFSERMLDGHARNPEHFFKRANSKNPALGGCGKDREMNKREWVQAVRALHQAHALTYGVKLDMRSNAARGLGPPEPKIGPAAQRGPIDTYREKIVQHVTSVRAERKPKAPPSPAPTPRPAPAALSWASAPARPAAIVSKPIQQQPERQRTRPAPATVQAPTPAPVRAPDPAPAQTLAERLQESFKNLLQWIKGQGGNYREINTQGAQCSGPVLHLDELHAVQRVGRGAYSIHRLDHLDKLPAVDDPKTEINYRDGRGTVSGTGPKLGIGE